MGSRETHDLIYDWNTSGAEPPPTPAKITLNDETLRDGLQSPSVYDPPLEAKKEILEKMAARSWVLSAGSELAGAMALLMAVGLRVISC